MDSITPSQIKTAIQRISQSVFKGMCHELGTSQQVSMRRDTTEIWEMVFKKVGKSNGCIVKCTGSKKEGFRLETSDLDIMLWPNNVRVIWELSQFQYYNIHRQILIACDCSESPPGYTLLYLLSPSMERKIQTACVRMNNRHYISSFKYGQIMCSFSLGNSTLNGPVASGVYRGGIEYDQAHSFASDFWPPSASPWLERCHSWPPPHVVEDILKNGCHFVAIGHKLGHHEDNEWRISFSLAEQKLVYSMNHCQFLTYGLLKLFLTEIINKEVRYDDRLLCSYHMKTAVFWVIQQNIIPYRCPQNLLECFWVCLKLILKWVYEGVCPNFFIPDNNMFLSKIHGEAQNLLFLKLYEFYKNGFGSLLHSPSIRSYIVDALYNPRLSICTVEHPLISETLFDLELFYEIYRLETFPTLNLQSCMRCLHTIEQMIGSPLMTQYQGVMLQQLTVSVLQQSAFILNVEIYACKNKLRYTADKISCHMLKLAAKFGCISDMLYIAMYYYKTLRYMEALSIIEVIKVKLAQPYVMQNFNVDAELYAEAVGGKSWSTKMRQAVALHIRLDNRINFINDLIPEQQAGLQNNLLFLTTPPFILLHMLEILCYKHVDPVRAQTALDDLQTLVHYDQGQLISLHLRDISWQILGICQQVTGNLQDALYSYYQSLRHEPFHKLQTVTEMRIQGIGQ